MPKHAETGEFTLFFGVAALAVNGRMYYNSSNGLRSATRDPQGVAMPLQGAL